MEIGHRWSVRSDLVERDGADDERSEGIGKGTKEDEDMGEGEREPSRCDSYQQCCSIAEQ